MMEAPTTCDCGEVFDLFDMVPQPSNPKRLVCRDCADQDDGEAPPEPEPTAEEEAFYASFVRLS